jgi:hypothetical protein
MNKLALAVATLALALPAQAKNVAGVDFPDTVDVGGQTLKLNGAGIRKKMLFKVYAGGLYVAATTSDASAVVAADAPKRVRMVFLRDVDKKKILETYKEGFENNSAGPGLAGLIAKLDQLAPALADMKEGSEMMVTYEPGKGTTVAAAGGGAPVTIEGKDFADALFRNWFGPKPADDDLKEAMLGK